MADREDIDRGERSGGSGGYGSRSGRPPSRSSGSRDRRDDDDDRRSSRGGRGGFGRRRRKVCEFCEKKATHIDYKDISTLNRYVESSGHIQSRRRMGTCARHQRMLSRAIKRARFIALLPFTSR